MRLTPSFVLSSLFVLVAPFSCAVAYEEPQVQDETNLSTSTQSGGSGNAAGPTTATATSAGPTSVTNTAATSSGTGGTSSSTGTPSSTMGSSSTTSPATSSNTNGSTTAGGSGNGTTTETSTMGGTGGGSSTTGGVGGAGGSSTMGNNAGPTTTGSGGGTANCDDGIAYPANDPTYTLMAGDLIVDGGRLWRATSGVQTYPNGDCKPSTAMDWCDDEWWEDLGPC